MARFATGAASLDERERVEEHVDRCPACLAHVAALAAGSMQSFLTGATEPLAHGVAAPSRREALAPLEPRFGDRVSRFIVLRSLGRGGMGIVVAAHDPALDRQVAIKVLHPAVWRRASTEARELLRAEARAMARLVHPNVVVVHDLGTAGEHVFVAMEWVDGSSLRDWLRAVPRGWREIVDVCVQAGRGIAAAHAAGLVHRDVKPQNVLVDAGGRARIADFGLAVLRSDPAAAGHGTVPDGTPAYMSPEQHRGAPVGFHSDQFSFCVMLFEALHGVRPFAGTTIDEIASGVLAGRIQPVRASRRVPRRVRRAIERGLARDPEARFPSMDALVDELDRATCRRAAPLPIAAAVVVGALLGGMPSDDRGPSGRDPADEAARVWNRERRAAVVHALGRDAAVAVAHLDRYVRGWVEARSVAEPAGPHDRCLDERIDELAALVDVLATGALDAAVGAVHELTPVAACGGAVDAPLPLLVSRRARLAALAARLAHARAMARVGREEEATAAVEAMLPDTRRLDHAPLTADVLYVLGGLRDSRGDLDDAERLLDEATGAAARGHTDVVGARIWIARVQVAARSGRRDAAEAMGDAARAAVARVGDPGWLRVALLEALSTAADARGELDEAEAYCREALGLARKVDPADDYRIAALSSSLGYLLARQHRFDAALPVLEDAYERARRAVGPAHASLSGYLRNLSSVHDELGRNADAAETARAAVALARPGSADAGAAMTALAAAVAESEPARAEELLRAVVALDTAAPQIRLSALINLGIGAHERGDRGAAAARLDEALALAGRVYSQNDPRLAYASTVRGIIAADAGDLTLAEARCRQGESLTTDYFGRDDPRRSRAITCLASVALARHRLADARMLAQEAVRVADLGTRALDQADARVVLADSLWRSGARRQARLVLDQAIARASGSLRAALVVQRRRWSHRSR